MLYFGDHLYSDLAVSEKSQLSSEVGAIPRGCCACSWAEHKAGPALSAQGCAGYPPHHGTHRLPHCCQRQALEKRLLSVGKV